MTDREIDLLVAEKVMGLGTAPWNDMQSHYSTDIKAAWEVVEKMRTDGFVGEFVQDVPDGASARFWDNPLFEAFTETKMPADDTLPLAICLAALRAKGVKV